MSRTLTKTSLLHNFHNTLFSEPNLAVYAVLDGAAIPGLLNQLNRFQAEFVCLYRGELAADMATMAPYLAVLPPDAEVTHWLLGLVGRYPGIFMRTKASMQEMRQHLRKLLTVYDAESKPVYFRYYDPRVLRVYLPSCHREESAMMFGPVSHFFAENESGHQLLKFSPLR